MYLKNIQHKKRFLRYVKFDTRLDLSLPEHIQ